MEQTVRHRNRMASGDTTKNVITNDFDGSNLSVRPVEVWIKNQAGT